MSRDGAKSPANAGRVAINDNDASKRYFIDGNRNHLLVMLKLSIVTFSRRMRLAKFVVSHGKWPDVIMER